MISIPINGVSNGEHPFTMVHDVSEIDGIFPEFIGQVKIVGTLRKTGKKLVVELTVRGTARLTCDYSLESFEEPIEASFVLSYLQDTELYLRQPNQQQRIEDDPYQLRLIREDDTLVDITADVAEELSVRLPIRRIAPHYRHMTFAEYAKSVLGGRVRVEDDMAPQGNSPWAVLEKLRSITDNA